jgi:hypothetical protein
MQLANFWDFSYSDINDDMEGDIINDMVITWIGLDGNSMVVGLGVCGGWWKSCK